MARKFFIDDYPVHFKKKREVNQTIESIFIIIVLVISAYGYHVASQF